MFYQKGQMLNIFFCRREVRSKSNGETRQFQENFEVGVHVICSGYILSALILFVISDHWSCRCICKLWSRNALTQTSSQRYSPKKVKILTHFVTWDFPWLRHSYPHFEHPLGLINSQILTRDEKPINSFLDDLLSTFHLASFLTRYGESW